MDRHEAAGTGGVDDFTRPVPVHEKRHPIGQHGICGAGSRMSIPLVSGQQHVQVIIELYTDQDTHRSSGKRSCTVSGIFYGLPDRLQKKPVLGIHHGRFLGRNLEKQGIELVHIRDESTVTQVLFLISFRQIVEHIRPVPPVRGNLRDQIGLGFQMLPEILQVPGLGKQTVHPDNGDGIRYFRFRIDRAIPIVLSILCE